MASIPFSSASFPGLPSSLAAASSLATPSHSLWTDLIAKQTAQIGYFSVDYEAYTSDEVVFSDDDLDAGRKSWERSLVGYAIGKRPFYGALLAAFQKKWKLKRSFELLTLEGDFFLFRFSCQEDFDTIWDNGPCILNGRPFFFKKWTWDFIPVKEELASIPLWVKFPNLPLCCWTEKSISRIASRIGIPLAVDKLTATQARLTFQRLNL